MTTITSSLLTPPLTKTLIIAFANSKGGVGKSTVCLMLATALAARGYPVRVLDLDLNQTIKGWADRHKPEIPNLTIEAVPEDSFVTRFKEIYQAQPREFVLLDINGSFDKTCIYAATVADLTITPMGLDTNELNEAFKLFRTITGLATKVGKQLTHRILINRHPTGFPAAYQQAILFNDIPRSGMTCLTTRLHARTAYPETFSTGQPPFLADRTRDAVSKAVDELDSLATEVLSLIVPVTLEAAA